MDCPRRIEVQANGYADATNVEGGWGLFGGGGGNGEGGGEGADVSRLGLEAFYIWWR